MDVFVEQAEQLFKIKLSKFQVSQFSRYENSLLEWNEKINLTAIKDVPGIRSKHFLDSLSLAQVFGNNFPSTFIDIGTGAGFPGIPLKIIFPQTKFVLVESVGKKARFCQLIIESLGLSGVDVITSRAEDLARVVNHREKYDVAVARAVANLPVLAEYLLPLVRLGGKMVAQKGISAHEETQTASNAFKILGGQLENIIQVELPGVSDERFIVVVKKVAATPPKYPRYAGIPAKNPL